MIKLMGTINGESFEGEVPDSDIISGMRGMQIAAAYAIGNGSYPARRLEVTEAFLNAWERSGMFVTCTVSRGAITERTLAGMPYSIVDGSDAFARLVES